MVDVLLEGALRRDAEPEVPVEARRHRVGAFGTVQALRPDRPVGRHVDLPDLAEDAAHEDLDRAALAVRAVAVVAHLRDDAARPRDVAEALGLPPRAHERLLHVDVAAALHRGDRAGGVHVVGRRDDDRVEVLLLVKQRAPVLVRTHLRAARRDLLRGRAQAVEVHVAERDDLFAEAVERIQVRAAAPARADEGHAQTLAPVAEAGRAQDLDRFRHVGAVRAGRAAPRKRKRARADEASPGKLHTLLLSASCQSPMWKAPSGRSASL